MKTVYKIIISIAIIALFMAVVYYGVQLFFWILYLLLKYPVYFGSAFVLIVSLLYIRKTLKTK